KEEDAKFSAATTDIFHFRQVSPRSAKAVGKLLAVNSNSLKPASIKISRVSLLTPAVATKVLEVSQATTQ
ncbi:hypothetical protein AVEN_213682-1, partial [Araneus ventricosus]